MRKIKIKEMTHPDGINATELKEKVVKWIKMNRKIDDVEFLIIREIFEKYEEAYNQVRMMKFRAITSGVDESVDIIFEDGKHFYCFFSTTLRKHVAYEHEKKITELRGGYASWEEEMSDSDNVNTPHYLAEDIHLPLDQVIIKVCALRNMPDTNFVSNNNLFNSIINNYARI